MLRRDTKAINLITEILQIDGIPEAALSKLKSLQVIISGADSSFKFTPHPDPYSALDNLPVLVQLKRPTFEDDWNEAGMVCYLTNMYWDADEECYHLDFNFGDFIDYNMKLLTESYYPNNVTRKAVSEGKLPNKKLYTALEAGMVTSTQHALLSPLVNGAYVSHRDDDAIKKTILDELLTPIILE